MAESMHELLEQVEVWKEGMEEKGLRVNTVSYTHLTLPTILRV